MPVPTPIPIYICPRSKEMNGLIIPFIGEMNPSVIVIQTYISKCVALKLLKPENNSRKVGMNSWKGVQPYVQRIKCM